MSRSKKISWKLLVLVALVSSFIFCSEVCAVTVEKKAVQTDQKEEIKVIPAERKCEGKAVQAEQKEGIKVIPAERKCEGKAVQEQQKDD
jgi:hypothetical protein